MAYYTLVTKERNAQAQWCIQFGDHDRSIVEYEKEEYRGYQCKIVRTRSARHSEIEDAVDQLRAQP